MVRRAGTGEAGETLVEVLMTVAIIGIAMVSILAGIGASIRFSATHRTAASSGVALLAAAEAVKGASGGSATCATLSTSTYASAVAAAPRPSGWSSADVSIASAACVAVNGVALPRITIVATAPAGGTESLTVVRRSVP